MLPGTAVYEHKSYSRCLEQVPIKKMIQIKVGTFIAESFEIWMAWNLLQACFSFVCSLALQQAGEVELAHVAIQHQVGYR